MLPRRYSLYRNDRADFAMIRKLLNYSGQMKRQCYIDIMKAQMNQTVIQLDAERKENK